MQSFPENNLVSAQSEVMLIINQSPNNPKPLSVEENVYFIYALSG